MRKEGKVEEENHITELIVMNFIGCCEAADDKSRFSVEFNHRAYGVVPMIKKEQKTRKGTSI